MSTKDYLEKDYYKVLGVSRTPSPEDRRRSAGPAVPPRPEQDERRRRNKVKEISGRTPILGDPAKRKEYDEAAQPVRRRELPFQRRGEGDRPWRPVPRSRRLRDRRPVRQPVRRFHDPARQDRGAGAEHRGRSRSDAVHVGSAVTMQTTSDMACPVPTRSLRPAPKTADVPRYARAADPGPPRRVGCSRSPSRVAKCRGRGMIVDDPCATCQGSGRGQSTRTMQVRIPAKCRRLGGSGSRSRAVPARTPARPATSTCWCRVRPHKVFGRKGDHLTVTVPVTFAEAVTGASLRPTSTMVRCG